MKFLLFLATALTLVHSGYLIPDFCRLPKDEGDGLVGVIYSVYYEPAVDRCLPFHFTGQGGNQNRFSNERECIRNCSANAEKMYPMNVVDACHFPKAVGNCTNRILRYYYDSVYDKCTRFHYSGCFGNGNRFLDSKSCNATCDGIHDDREQDPDDEWDTPVAIICGVLLSLVVCSIIITVVVLTVKSKKEEAKKKGAKNRQQDVPLQEATVEVS